ncbi:putative CT20 protein [Pseudoloma neurophilia]|uniref:Putative CT20 protein n=1 Tax=Pseudoloma neurophilia TaxID=146866 RepID=A0A0R0MAG4_9MICR|nr:putative CT20 protein [Pseudoloma neurophilia]
MASVKKPNLGDPQIKMRIIKALNTLRPVGTHKELILLAVLKKYMKKPNIITVETIKDFIAKEFTVPEEKDEIKYHNWNEVCKDIFGVDIETQQPISTEEKKE